MSPDGNLPAEPAPSPGPEWATLTAACLAATTWYFLCAAMDQSPAMEKIFATIGVEMPWPTKAAVALGHAWLTIRSPVPLCVGFAGLAYVAATCRGSERSRRRLLAFAAAATLLFAAVHVSRMCVIWKIQTALRHR